ncbi:MAG: glycyl-radical enzyme activating protein [Clostridiales bacterium]|nr:glycyl-radical enzyme activating protein [Clostridiales bacterium]
MIENVTGRIYDIQGFSVHDGPGIRTTVFTKGCPLHCLWCHSPESQYDRFELSFLPVKCVGKEKCGGLCLKACPNGSVTETNPEESLIDHSMVTKVSIDREKCAICLKCANVCPSKALSPTGYTITVEEAFARVNKDRFFFKKEGGVTISGGEPMQQFAFTLNLAKKCKANGINVCLDTTGFAPEEQLLQILPYVDLFLYDIKHMDSKKHESFTAAPNERILKNAALLADNGGALQIRVPVIPKLNADRENLIRTAEFCKSLGSAVKLVQLLPYHAMGKSKYTRMGLSYKLKNVDPPDDLTMKQTLEMFTSLGLSAKIR